MRIVGLGALLNRGDEAVEGFEEIADFIAPRMREAEIEISGGRIGERRFEPLQRPQHELRSAYGQCRDENDGEDPEPDQHEARQHRRSVEFGAANADLDQPHLAAGIFDRPRETEAVDARG